MTRWLIVPAMVGLVVGGAAWWLSPVGAQPSVEAQLWRAAGVVQASISTPAPPLRLHDLSGELVDLRQFRGRLVMVYFWATW